LRGGRQFVDEHEDELLFERYDGGLPINEIEVCADNEEEAAVWHSDDLALWLAGRDLLDAAQLALRELRGFYNDGESEAVRVLAGAITKATGGRA
jgi:hypothetical protein